MKNKLRSLLALAVVAIAVFMFTMAVYGTGKFDVRNGTLVKYSGGGGAVKIPDNVTIIGEEAFAECRKITSVTVPNGVTSIERAAFRNCDSMTTVSLPDSLRTIGESAFNDCDSLRTVEIPSNVSSIGDEAFWICKSLASISVHDKTNHMPAKTEFCTIKSSLHWFNIREERGMRVSQFHQRLPS